MSNHRVSTIFAAACLLAHSAVVRLYQAPAPGQAASPQVSLELNAPQSKINWTLSATFHSVHGTFALMKGTVQFDPATGAVSGDIIADARSGESGNSSRDDNMHLKVLESGKYAEIKFSPDRVDGKVAMQGVSKIQIHGIFEIHGTKHELTVPAEVELLIDRWTAKSTFDIPYTQWGMKNPSNAFLHVGDTVRIELGLSGHLNRQAPT
jgi:polyisoprenoid-binding protein YceI